MKLTPEERALLSRMGVVNGRKGGKARAASLTAKRRSEIASQAAKARWAKTKPAKRPPRQDSSE